MNKNQTKDPIAYTELKLLAHAGDAPSTLQLDRVELSVLKDYKWKPVTVTKIGDTAPISANEAVASWFEEEDKWHIPDSGSADWMTLEEAVNKEWCHRHKTPEKLIPFLRDAGYPAHLIEVNRISAEAYGVAREIHSAKDRERNKQRMAKKRAQSKPA
jgi:hypothetical protein